LRSIYVILKKSLLRLILESKGYKNGGKNMKQISVEDVYQCSDDVVAREIEGELIIVPLVAGIGDLEDELFTMNETGKAIWDRLDGKTSLDEIIGALQSIYRAEPEVIEKDVLGLVEELVKRRMLIDASTL
jgi:hypothetical protein